MGKLMHPVIRILVVDDQCLVRSGICANLADVQNIQVIGQASTGQEALELSVQLKPDIILLDLNLPDMDGLQLAMVLQQKAPKTKILIVTTSVDNFLIPKLFACGVKGFFNKTSGCEDILKAIVSIQAGRTYICPNIAKKIKTERNNASTNPFEIVSKRELQVILQIANGSLKEEICEKLSISLSTLKTYRNRVFRKLAIQNDVELTLMLIRYGLLS